VSIIDYCQIIPLLSEWSEQAQWFSGCSRDVLFFTDGKPWKLTRPGRGDAAAALVRNVGENNLNLVQQAYYNGHYGFCGAKVLHVLQVDGISYSFIAPLRQHDAMVLHSSSMITMPVKVVTDKAYGRSRHFYPLHTTAELRLMNGNDRALAEAEDSRNRGPRMAVEVSFNNIVRKFSNIDYFARHHILQQGRSNWPYIRCLWDMHVFFYNLFTCAKSHGNPCNAISGVSPPSVSEYLHSANNHLYIPFPGNEEEGDNFGLEENGPRLFYHIL
jgi:hypothetical protein